MVTNVKMQVTPELSKRVQDIVFAAGGKIKETTPDPTSFPKCISIFSDPVKVAWWL